MKANEATETYPIQFRDKTDEYLWKEHHILGGCCSSIEEIKYSIAREVTEKLTDTFIEKACKWLADNARAFDEGDIYNAEDLVEYFKDYMKGE